MQRPDRADEIDYNPFYKALQTEFKSTYLAAQNKCCLICVPQASSLPTMRPFKRTFIDSHILIPSKTVKNVYECNFFGKTIEWTVRGGLIKSKSLPVMEACILAEELGFNTSNEAYTVILISQPLDQPYNDMFQSSVPQRLSLVDYCLTNRETMDEHKKFLYAFEEHGKELSVLENALDKFNNNYLIVDNLLEHTSQKLSALVSTTVEKFLTINKRINSCPDTRVKEALRSSIESYIMGRCHDKVFAAVQRWRSEEDKLFKSSCEHFSVEAARQELHKDFRCMYPKSSSELSTLDKKRSPTEKISCLSRVLEYISIDVKDAYSSSLRFGEPNILTSDDMIAISVILIVQSKLYSLPSNLYYIENFCWSALSSSHVSYCLTTFQATLQILKHKPLPKSNQKSTTITSSHPKIYNKSSPKPFTRRSSDILDQYNLTFDQYKRLSYDHPSTSNDHQTSNLDYQGRHYDHHQMETRYQRQDYLHNPVVQREDKSLTSSSRPNEDVQSLHNSRSLPASGGNYGPFISKLMEQDGTVSSDD